MNSRLGIELGARVIRGVRLDGWPRRRVRVAEVAWDSAKPQEAIHALREHLGPASRLAVALDLSLLFVKQVKLPPLPAADKANILRVEPERFFPVRAEDLVPTARANDDLVFATRETPLAGWVAALEELGPVDRVEPGPMALSRALASARITRGTVLLNDGVGWGIVEVKDGRVASARRTFGELENAAAAVSAGEAEPPPPRVYLDPWDEGRANALRALLPNVTVAPLPSAGELPPHFLNAYGAALGLGRGENGGVLHTSELEQRITRRRRRDLAVAAAACVAALLFALVSADGWRARTKRALDTGLAALNAQAAPALALQTQLATLQREAQAVTQIETERSDPLEVLLALSQRVPRGVYLRAISASGAEWRLEGFAPNAAQLLGLLDAAPAFHEVRFLSATNRAVVGNRTYDSFTLAFRYTPAP